MEGMSNPAIQPISEILLFEVLSELYAYRASKWINVDNRDHRLRTLNEGINQRNLKIWADVADKICFGRT